MAQMVEWVDCGLRGLQFKSLFEFQDEIVLIVIAILLQIIHNNK